MTDGDYLSNVAKMTKIDKIKNIKRYIDNYMFFLFFLNFFICFRNLNCFRLHVVYTV